MEETNSIPVLEKSVTGSLQRFENWWKGGAADRPVLELPVAPKPYSVPMEQPTGLRERWMNPSWQVASALAELQACSYIAETLPIYVPNVGPDLTATLLGAELEFGEHTSWAIHPVKDVDEWKDYLKRPADFSNPYWQAIEEMTRLSLEQGAGKIVVGLPDLHGAYDMMVALRGPEELCLDMIDKPDLVSETAIHFSDLFNESMQRAWQPLRAAGMPATTWAHFLHNGFAYVSSCDFWCLISSEMALEWVAATIEREAVPLERSIFHLDGPDALRHLDWLLQCDHIHAIQWVYGAGKGPATRWLDIYRKCLDHGKSIQVLAENPRDLLTIAKELGSRGVWISLTSELESAGEAEDLLKRVESV